MANSKNNSPASVRQRLLNLAREKGQVFDVVLVNYGLERLMYRLSISKHRDSFVLKGGMLVTLWIGDENRVTRDADFLGFGEASEERLISVFSEVLAQQVDDGLIYDVDKLTARTIREEQQYGGIRLRTVANLGKARIPIVVDVGFGDATIAPGLTIEYPTLLDMPAGRIRAYPPASVVAEKFHAIVTLGLVNSRMKDYYDLWAILNSLAIEEGELADAIAATFSRRVLSKTGTNLPSKQIYVRLPGNGSVDTILPVPRARKHLVCLNDTPYYHITSRCVRRAFLCGTDIVSGKSYEHRREWIEDRIRVLSSLFCIDLCAYAVMSNHYHLVVKINPDEAKDWSDDEVLERWTALFRGPLIVQQYRNGQTLSEVELETLRSMTTVFRSRLRNLSWFMKCLNEPIARKANAEDGCTGHFWEARFHSEPLCSDQALIAAMAYVDLNPIRARMAKTPEASKFTSIRTRIQADEKSAGTVSRMLERGELFHFNDAIKPLLGFSNVSNRTINSRRGIDVLPIYKLEYLRLVNITGRIVRRGKRGRIDPTLAPILSRLSLSTEQWVQVSTRFRQYYRSGHLRFMQAA